MFHIKLHSIALLLSYISSDINECSEEIDDCEENCANTVGSYKCYCDIGFELLNTTHCTGMSGIMYVTISLFFYRYY